MLGVVNQLKEDEVTECREKKVRQQSTMRKDGRKRSAYCDTQMYKTETVDVPNVVSKGVDENISKNGKVGKKPASKVG